MSIVKRIFVITSLICVVFCSFIISGSAAGSYTDYNPNFTDEVSFGRTYAVVFDTVINQYVFKDIFDESPGMQQVLTYNEEDYFKDPVLSGELITIDLWSTELGVFVTIPVHKWSNDESFNAYCTVSRYDVPGEWEGAYLFSFTCTASSYHLYNYFRHDFLNIGLIFDDQNSLTTALPFFLFAEIESDPYSYPYYDGLSNYNDELQNQYDQGYQQGELSTSMIDREFVYKEGYNAGFQLGNQNVIEKNVVAGFLQGTWFGISQFVNIFLGESTIFGVSLLSILSSLLVVIVVVAIVKKVF